MIQPQTLAALTEAFPAVTHSEFRGATRAVVPRESLLWP